MSVVEAMPAPACDHPRPVCGIDEAGRGPLAGPVVAAAVILDPARTPAGIDDSKRLRPAAREALCAELLMLAEVGVGIAEPAEIDARNILGATLAAMARAVAALPRAPGLARVDGNRAPLLPCPVETIVGGDASDLSIGAASIIAKVVRDGLMVRAGALWPGYGFAVHKGYPSPAHRTALAALGPCPIHRRSFALVRAAAVSR